MNDYPVRRTTVSPGPWRVGGKIPQNLYDGENNPIGVLFASEVDAAIVVRAMEIMYRLELEASRPRVVAIKKSTLRAILNGE